MRIFGSQERASAIRGALPHAAAQLERVGVDGGGGAGDADKAEQFDHQFAGFLPGELAVQSGGADDLIADGVDGAERGHRLLEDEGDLGAAD